MRVLTFVLCGLCLTGGAVTSFAMTGFSPVDEKPVTANAPRPVETKRSNRPPVSIDDPTTGNQRRDSNPFDSDLRLPDSDRDAFPRDDRFHPPGRDTNSASPGPMRARQTRRTVIETHMEPIPAAELAAAKKLLEAIKSLKETSESEAQKKATETIQQQLSEQFDLDLQQREKELAEVEAKVKSLRDQLDKRKAAREDIITLRLKTITNDAAGLGFPSGGGANEPMELFESRQAPAYDAVFPNDGPVRTFPNPNDSFPEDLPFPALKPQLDPM